MLYLVVDPKVFVLSNIESVDKQTISKFLAALFAWSRASDEYDIEFGISGDCISALVLTRTSAFNREFISELTTRIPGSNAETIITAISPLFNRLQARSHLLMPCLIRKPCGQWSA